MPESTTPSQAFPEHPDNGQSLEEFWTELFQTHWAHLVNFARSQGYSKHDAEDHTQAFFAKLVKSGRLSASPLTQNTTRAYLFTALKRFLVDRYRHQTSLKRGGGHLPLSDSAAGPNVFGGNPSHASPRPDVDVDRQWARRLIEEVYTAVEEEYHAKGKSDLFDAMKAHLQWSTVRPSHTQVARQLGMKVGTARLAAYRIRQRFAAVMRSKIASKARNSREAEEDLRHLLNVFSAA